MELGENGERRSEAEPAVEVVAARAEAEPEADHRDQREQRLRREGSHHQERLVVAGVQKRRQRGSGLVRDSPREREHDRDGHEHLADRPTRRARPALRERGGCDQERREQAAADRGPGLGPVQRLAAERGRDRKRERRDRDGAEAAAEEEVEAAPVDREPNPGEQCDDRGRERHRRVQHQPDVWKLVRVAEARVGEEQRQRSAEQPDQEHLAPEPGLVVVALFVPHKGLVGRRAAADKGFMRILIVDDHPITRAALTSLLEGHGFTVAGEAADGEEAIESARRLSPDLVLLDLSMPGLDGLGALPRLREAAPDSEVVVLTASGTEENLLAAIRGGAAGYLLKSEPPERIAEFLRGVAEGKAALSGEVARRLLDQVREGGLGRGVPDSIAASLSARELEVLLLLDEHLGTDEIATRLFISEHTVRSHVKSLMRKLNVSSRREALDALASARAA